MRTHIIYKRNEPSTACGDSITIMTTYSSFNTAEIDNIENYYKQTIGYAVVIPDSENEHDV